RAREPALPELRRTGCGEPHPGRHPRRRVADPPGPERRQGPHHPRATGRPRPRRPRRRRGLGAHPRPRRCVPRPDRRPRHRKGSHAMSTLPLAVRDSTTMLRRNLLHARRYPSMTFGLIAIPIIFLLLFVYIFGNTLATGLGGGRAAYTSYITPTILM